MYRVSSCWWRRTNAAVGQHLNLGLGYTAAGGEVAGTVAGLTATPVPDELNYSGGVELVANPRLTLIGDFVGRTLRGAGRLDLVSKTFLYAVPGLSPPPFSISLDELAPRSGNLPLLLGSAGVKFNLAGNLLVSGSVLFPLTNAGLRSRVTTVIGVDYAF